MQKWEYLEVLGQNTIWCNPAKTNEVANIIKKSFPNSKIKANNGVITTDISTNLELIDFLGSEGWELVGVYRYSDRNLLFKRFSTRSDVVM